MTKAVASPVSKERLALFKAMTPALQKIAKQYAQRMASSAVADLAACWDIGHEIHKMLSDKHRDAQFGKDPVEQLRVYFGLDNDYQFLAMRTLASNFTRDFVLERTRDGMAEGNVFLTLSHWMTISRLASRAAQEHWLTETISKRLSSSALEAAILERGDAVKNKRASGRNPAEPVSVIQCLNRVTALGNTFMNYSKVSKAYVAKKVPETPPDEVTDALLEKIDAAHKKLKELTTEITSLSAELREARQRVVTVLDGRQAPEEEALEEEPPVEEEVLEEEPVAAASTNGRAPASGKSTEDRGRRFATRP